MIGTQLSRASAGAVAGVVVRHAPSGRFLGMALMLVDRADAISFESASAAERFLERHASEPCYDVVTSAAHLAA